MMNICNDEEEQKVSLLALFLYRQDVHRFFFVSSSIQVADADKHFDFFFLFLIVWTSNRLTVYIDTRICMFLVFAIRASSSLNVWLFFKRVKRQQHHFSHLIQCVLISIRRKDTKKKGDRRRSKSNQTVFSSWFMKMSIKFIF